MGYFGVLFHLSSVSQLLLTCGNTSQILLVLIQAHVSFQCPVLLHQKLRHSGKRYNGVQKSLRAATPSPRSTSVQPSHHQLPHSTDEATEVQGLPPRVHGGFRAQLRTCLFHPHLLSVTSPLQLVGPLAAVGTSRSKPHALGPELKTVLMHK